MEIIYENVDITDMVQMTKCIVRDRAGNRCDSLELEFDNAATWNKWSPEKDDVIIVKHSVYNSGTMYVNTILPEDGRYRIIASSLPCDSRKKATRSFYKKTIEEIMRMCSIDSKMDYRIYGIDGNITIPYIERENESCASFLQKMLLLEGAELKCINGTYTAIGVEYAQYLDPVQSILITAGQQRFRHEIKGQRVRSLTVRSPYATATATDTDADVYYDHIELNMPVLDKSQAGRWARNSLLDTNRNKETITMETDFNGALSAMTGVDIDGGTQSDGEWLIQDVEHDLISMSSKAVMHRNIYSIE